MSAIVNQYGLPIINAEDAARSVARPARLVNLRTGMGTASDKNVGSEFVAVQLTREDAERLYQMSWAAAKMVDIPVDDMFSRWRRWTGNDAGKNQAMEDAEADLNLMTELPGALKAGKIFGSSLLIVCPANGDFESPLKSDKVSEGGIANLWVVDRWACSVQNWQTDPSRKRYGKPYQYRVNGRIFGSPAPYGISKPTTTGNIVVNADRVIRFDGKRSPLTEGWTSGPWEREWGTSVYAPAIEDILRDSTINAGVGHLVDEASVWVNKIHGFKEAIKGRAPPGEPTVDEIALEVGLLRSLYRSIYMDVEDTAERVNVSFAGLKDIMNGQAQRLSAIAGIPFTRFMATSATGLNATGEGDARNWLNTVEAMRSKDVEPVLRRRLDIMIARHAGIAGDPPEYEWIPLSELTDAEKAEVTAKHTQATLDVYNAGTLIDEAQALERLAQDSWWKEVGPWNPNLPDLDENIDDENNKNDLE